MENADIAAQLRAFLKTEFPNPGIELSDSIDLLDQWFIDSLGIVLTILFIESTFGVAVSRADINAQNFRNITTLSEFVVERTTA